LPNQKCLTPEFFFRALISVSQITKDALLRDFAISETIDPPPPPIPTTLIRALNNASSPFTVLLTEYSYKNGTVIYNHGVESKVISQTEFNLRKFTFVNWIVANAMRALDTFSPLRTEVVAFKEDELRRHGILGENESLIEKLKTVKRVDGNIVVLRY